MKPRDWRALRQLGNLGSLGFTLAGSIVVGLALGIGIDHWLEFTRPWGTLGGILFGIVAGFVNVIEAVLPRKPKRNGDGTPRDDHR